MKYNVLTTDQQDLLGNRTDLIVSVTQDILMAPVKCIDCEQYVPFGWVEFGTVKCPQNLGATGVQYGHRIPTEVFHSVKDSTINAMIREI